MSREIHLFDDAYKGMKAEWAEELRRFRDVDLDRTAGTFGCLGMRGTAPGDLEPTLEKAITGNRPLVVDVTSDVAAAAKGGWIPAA